MTDPRPDRPDWPDEHPDESARLRRLLHDAVSDVEPRPGLDAIHSRTKVHPMSSRPWILTAGAAVVATAAVIAAVNLTGNDISPARSSAGPAAGASHHSAAKPQRSSASSAPAVASASASASPQPGGALLPVYYVGEDAAHGPRLYREFHPGRGTSIAVEAVHDAVTTTPDDPDYTTLWPKGTDVQSVESDGSTLTVSLTGPSLGGRPSGMSADEATASVQQLVYTAQAAYQDRAPVRFELDGRPADTVLGVDTSSPVKEQDPMDALGQVWVIDPAQGAEVSSGFKVTGLAASFEANVQWQLKQGSTVVRHGFTTARECCTMAPYSFRVTAPAGRYTLLVSDSDPSGGGEGPGPWIDTKDLTIR